MHHRLGEVVVHFFIKLPDILVTFATSYNFKIKTV